MTKLGTILMNAFDALLILILQNLESKIESVEEKSGLLQLGIEILPHTAALSKELENHYSEKFELCLGSLKLLNEDDDARVVKVHSKYDSEYLLDRSWFDYKSYNFYKEAFCVPGTIKLNAYNEVMIEAETLSSESEYAHSIGED
jgi:hypothetical protein